MEFVKKDLEEFSNAVKNEASNVVSTTGSVLEKTLKVRCHNDIFLFFNWFVVVGFP